MAEKNILATRTHATLTSRLAQINLNWLCYKAGKPYISARLHRGLHEDEQSWDGIEDETTKEVLVPARVDRSHFVPYATRIVDKIEEHIYAAPIKRDNADADFLKNTDRTGRDVNGVMKALFEYWTVCGWAWIGVDRTSATGKPSVSRADKERNKDGVFWTVYAPWEVVDWSFDDAGNLRWLITQRNYLDNSDPNVEAQALISRTLWRPGGGERMTLNAAGAVIGTETFTIPFNGIPFRHVGEITDSPHWFDSVEMIAASLMNMESEAHTNLSKGVYALPVVPSDVANGGAASGLGKGREVVEATDTKVTVQKIFGRKNPIFEDESSKGVTRFVSPDAGDVRAYPEEIERTKKALYEVAGLGISKQKDTADAESADAKQFDHLDINAVLRDIAQQLQRIEEMAVEMSSSFDNTFNAYAPVYPTEFNVIDFGSMMAGVEKIDALGIQIPKTLRVAIVRSLSENIPNMSEAERKAIEDEVKALLDEEESALERIAGSATVAGTGDVTAVADTALNGAQVASLVQIIDAVVSGQMPSDTAKAAISAAFPTLSDAQVLDIVAPLARFRPKAPIEPQATV